MNRKEASLLLAAACIPFIGYFLNPNLAYLDAFAFLSQTCGISYSGTHQALPFLPFIPCNVIIIKTILLGLYIISVFSIAIMGEKMCSDNGWRTGFYAACLTPLLFQEAMKFENDIFGWSLSFIGLSLFCIGVSEQSRSKKYAFYGSALILCTLATFLWGGALLSIFTMGLMALEITAIALPIFIFKLEELCRYAFGRVGTDIQIAEEQVGAGLLPIMFLLPATLDIPKRARLAGWAMLIVGFIKIKYMLFAIPFLAMGFVEFENKYKPKFKRWPNLIVVGLAFCLAYSMLGLFASPTTGQFALVDETIELGTKDKLPIYNDWQYGWWFVYKGFDTNFKASYPNPDYNLLSPPYYALTSRDLNCFLVQKELNLKLWRC